MCNCLTEAALGEEERSVAGLLTHCRSRTVPPTDTAHRLETLLARSVNTEFPKDGVDPNSYLY